MAARRRLAGFGAMSLAKFGWNVFSLSTTNWILGKNLIWYMNFRFIYDLIVGAHRSNENFYDMIQNYLRLTKGWLNYNWSGSDWDSDLPLWISKSPIWVAQKLALCQAYNCKRSTTSWCLRTPLWKARQRWHFGRHCKELGLIARGQGVARNQNVVFTFWYLQHMQIFQRVLEASKLLHQKKLRSGSSTVHNLS